MTRRHFSCVKRESVREREVKRDAGMNRVKHVYSVYGRKRRELPGSRAISVRYR